MGDVDADALLAQALWAAEQADVYDHEWEGGERSDDSDYEGNKPPKRKKQKQRRAHAKKPRKPAAGAAAAAQLQPASIAVRGQVDTSTDQPRAASHQELECGASTAPDPEVPGQQAQLQRPAAGTSDAKMVGAAAASTSVATVNQTTTEQQQPTPQNSDSESGPGQQQHGPSGRRRRKDCGQKRDAGRAWTAPEEAAFLAGLEQHGRDWRAVAELVITRDSRQVASHAQKHFVKLCLAGQPLPKKVAESGRGYTLSGKLLDPGSAAAQAYGFRPELLMRLEGEALATALAGILPAHMSRADATQHGSDQVARLTQSLKPHKCSKTGGGGSSSCDAVVAPDKSTTSRVIAAAQAGGRTVESSESQQLAAALAVPPPVIAASEKAKLEGAYAKSATAVAAAGTHSLLEIVSTTAAPSSASASVKAVTELSSAPAADTGNGAAAGVLREHPTAHLYGTTAISSAINDETAGTAPADATSMAQPDLETAGVPNPAGQTAAAAGTSQAAVSNTAVACGGHVTEYVRSRPRRGLAGQRLLQLGATSESLELLPCKDFIGPVGSGLPSAQPYSVEVDMQAMLVMEVHAHCSSYEVIGLLGGSWDSSTRLMQVTAAYPCSRAAGSDARTSVELAPEAEVEARGAMAAARLRCVGWYHSHPVFEPSPSLKDCENQRNYQALTRDTSTAAAAGLEPFVGFILSPFDLSLPRPHTNINAFLVQQKGLQLMPFNVRYGMVQASELPCPAVRTVLRTLLSALMFDAGRTDFNATWRAFTALGGPSGTAPLGPPVTKLEKLLAALRWQASYVMDKAGLEVWLQQLCADVQEIWDLPLSALKGKPGPQQQQLQCDGYQQLPANSSRDGT